MSARLRLNGRPLPQRGAAGYSMIEMTIALGMAVVIGAGLFAVYNAQQNASRQRRRALGLQTDCNLVMDQIKGELLLAGYLADRTDGVETFTEAQAGTVTFEYFDDKAKYNDADPSESSYDPGVSWDANYTGHTQIKYLLSGSSLQRKIRRWNTVGTPAYTPEFTQVLADNVQSLSFSYDRSDNTSIGMPVSTADLEEIRNVKINLACQSPTVDPVSGKRQLVTLTASVQPRNVGLEANPKDTTPPAVPAELVVWDPGGCSSLQLRWKANTEADLDGYTIYYGLASGAYSKRARLSRGPGTAGQFERYTLPSLTATTWASLNPTPPALPAPAMYHIVITAHDKSGNQSPYSTEVANSAQQVSAEPAPTAFGSAASDTTINPAAPPDPASFTAIPPALPTQNTLTLTWSPVVADGLQGYLLYRDENSASFTPIGTTAGSGNCIAGLAQLGPGATTWTDTGLEGCKTYYYKVVPVHCDNTLPVGTRGAQASGAPLDNTPPPTPTLTALSGYGRINLTLNKNAPGPDFNRTNIWFNKGAQNSGNFPTLNADGTVGNGTLIPRWSPPEPYIGPGTFTGTASVTIPFTHETDPTTIAPFLELDKEYYFLAVSYDNCGNNTPALPIARTAGVQCSDCESDLPCFGPPPSFSTITAEGCFGTDGITLSWDYPYLNEAALSEPYRDLAGFHLWRREGDSWGDGSGAVELTGGTPAWATVWLDGSGGLYPAPEEGKIYSYRVQSTDCYWEQHNGKPPADWPDPANDPNDNYTDSFRANLYLGRPLFEPFFSSIFLRFVSLSTPTAGGLVDISVRSASFSAEELPAVGGVRTVTIDTEQFACTGASTPSPGASTLTGCTRGANGTVPGAHAAGALVTPEPSQPPVDALTGDLLSSDAATRFQHNLVKLRLRNTATGTLKPHTVDATWQNTAVRLKEVFLGDGSTTIAQGPYPGDSASDAPFTLTDASLAALDEEIPLSLAFKNPDSTIDANANMRSDQLSVTLAWTNPSTDSATCTTTAASRVVPPGPIVSRVTQSQPSAGTIAQAVPGNASSPTPPNSVIVPGTLTVDVFAEVLDTSLAGLAAVKLYYKVDNSATAPPLSGTYPEFSGSGYGVIDMEYIAGNEWRTPAAAPIASHDGSGVWFFAVAVDNNGDFDREPEIGRGGFQYYQQQSDVCNNIPGPPAISGSDSSGAVTLNLTSNSKNTDGSWFTDSGGFKIYRSFNGGPWVLWRTVGSAPGPVEDLSADLATANYAYYATSIDTCVPANESTASGIFSECIGAPDCTVSLSSTANPTFPGNEVGISLSICAKRNTVSGEQIWAQSCSSTTGGADADPIRLIEDGDTGTFRIDSAVYGGRTALKTYLSASYPSPAIDLDLRVASSDTVSVGGFSDSSIAPSGWDATCASTPLCVATLSVIPDPCVNPVTPTMSGVTASFTSGSCSANNNNVRLTWIPPATGTYTYFRVYRCNGASCEPTAVDRYADQISTDDDAALGGFQWIDTNPGGKLDNAAIKLHYKVTAVNDRCATDVKETPLSSVTTVNDTCGAN